MSRHWSHLKKYRCANDCRSSGCPGHQMRIVYVCTSDTIVVEIDPDEAVRPGSGASENSRYFDPDEFDAMVDLHIEMRAKWAADRIAQQDQDVGKND